MTDTTSTDTPRITPDMAGTWLDGSQGWRNAARVVWRAQEYGFTVTEEESAILDAYYDVVGKWGQMRDGEESLKLPSGEVLDAGSIGEAVSGQGELSDRATEYLQSLAPRGYVFEWDMGELSLQAESDYEYLVTWQAGPYRLDLYDTGGRVEGASATQYRLAYVFSHEGAPVFTGEDYGCSPMHAINGPRAIVGLLGFLSLRPGDTDAEYFADYSTEQLAWRDEHAEDLACYVGDDEECLAQIRQGMRQEESEPVYVPVEG